MSAQGDSEIDLANKYFDLRTEGKNEELMKLLSEEIVLEIARDGKHEGKEAILKYLNKVKPTGTWEKAQRVKNQVSISGKVYMFINVSAYFEFDGGLIKSIEVKRGRPE